MYLNGDIVQNVLYHKIQTIDCFFEVLARIISNSPCFHTTALINLIELDDTCICTKKTQYCKRKIFYVILELYPLMCLEKRLKRDQK